MIEHKDDMESWPEVSRIRIMDYMMAKYPEQPGLAAMFQSAAIQKLLNGKIAWNDLGVTDHAEQLRMEAEVDKLIAQFSNK
jgi:hypothetical protein